MMYSIYFVIETVSFHQLVDLDVVNLEILRATSYFYSIIKLNSSYYSNQHALVILYGAG